MYRELSNGKKINDLCLGTGIITGGKNELARMYHFIRNIHVNAKQIEKDIGFTRVVKAAMKQGGSCLFDTSAAYQGAEYALGKLVNKYPRENYQIVTKLSNEYQYKNSVKSCFEKSLKELGMNYVDIYLMHWPVPEHYIESWKVMEELYLEGKCKAIGVCNCNIHHLEEIKNKCEIMPMINQFECHPLFTQDELRDYCNKNKIQVMAYTSTARMDRRLKITPVAELAKKYNKTIAQIILRWHQQIGNIPIVNTSNIRHCIENMSIYDFNLMEDEISRITATNIDSRLRYDPDRSDLTKL